MARLVALMSAGDCSFIVVWALSGLPVTLGSGIVANVDLSKPKSKRSEMSVFGIF